MNDHRYILERSSKKYNCPGCNQKKFTRYIDTATGEHLADHVGRCDRENSCAHHYKPNQFFNDNPGTTRQQTPTSQRPIPEQIINRPIDYLPLDLLEKSVMQHDRCNLFPFLERKFTQRHAKRLCESYFIGSNKDGNTVFWQVDITGEIRQAKVMQYDPRTGKRNRDTGALFAGKKILDNKNANLQQCFFGEFHLYFPVNKNKPVAIVESEKTTAIASVYFPQFIWLATGGKYGCNWTEKNVCKVLAGREVVLFPDLGAYDIWKGRGRLLANVAACKVVTSDLLENCADADDRKAGLDLADYLLRVEDSSGLALTDYHYPVIFDTKYDEEELMELRNEYVLEANVPHELMTSRAMLNGNRDDP